MAADLRPVENTTLDLGSPRQRAKRLKPVIDGTPCGSEHLREENESNGRVRLAEIKQKIRGAPVWVLLGRFVVTYSGFPMDNTVMVTGRNSEQNL